MAAPSKKRVPLERVRIMEAAHEEIATDGMPAFSMRALGARLGVEAMSLYHHFPSKAHLLDAMFDQMMSEIDVNTDAMTWREGARAWAVAFRAKVLARPDFAVFVLTHRNNTRAGLAFIERIVKAFSRGGFSGEELARAFRSYGYYLTGALLEETAGYARGPSAAEVLAEDEQRQIAPTLLSIGRFFREEEREATFLYGLDLLIDGLDARRTR